MSCCEPGELPARIAGQVTANEEILAASRVVGDGVRRTDLSVPTIHCGGCIHSIEKALGRLAGVDSARVNLSTRRVTVRWRGETPPPLIAALKAIGHDAHLHDIGVDENDHVFAELVRALAVAGFAASNIMLLSVSIWAGAEPATRDLFHWISALIAFPALAYSGRVFYRSAWRSLRHGRTNMDVPISLGVLLAFGMSLYETVHHGAHAYFDAATCLLLFLLAGRTLDHMMRERARQAVRGLARLAARGAMVRRDGKPPAYLPVDEIRPGMTILLAAGDRVPVDARVVDGVSEVDRSLVSGESQPQPARTGALLQAGILNLTNPLTVVATATAKDSFLAEMVRMMEAAEAGRSVYRRIADRAAGLYAPVVHTAALLTFVGWIAATGDLHRAITVAIAVLIITCPCALGLAVPMVQVVAARRLFEKGIMAKDGAAMERLAEVDSVIFDKTGTLTLVSPQLLEDKAVDPAALAIAAAIAAHSSHPYSRALAAAGRGGPDMPVKPEALSEHPGSGLEARIGATVYRLGRAEWALAGEDGARPDPDGSVAVLSGNGRWLATFRFQDRMRPDAAQAMAELAAAGLDVEMVSGDREEPVRRLAAELGLRHIAHALPGEKAAHVASRAAAGRKVLMVGDGLNDAPALVAAHASMAPASAADVGRNAADFVFLRESLLAVPQAIAIARAAGRLVKQNLMLAVAYNAVAVPVAVLGHVTPLIAAVAMSLSSLVVVANALRLKGDGRAGRGEAGATAPGAARSLEPEPVG